ncbi:hypothetical protein HMPREF1548_05113 [Clostridium sp. KLE 1755]|nr:hypothetical protein HMPREF1548_05113 [Clostridium sp. KLE 1755]
MSGIFFKMPNLCTAVRFLCPGCIQDTDYIQIIRSSQLFLNDKNFQNP